MKYFLAFLLIAAAAASAQARCVWQFECDRSGNCRQVPICDSTLDIAPIRPLAVPPIVLPPVAPIPRPVVPPIGTSSCRQAYLCNSMGQCGFQTVCN